MACGTPCVAFNATAAPEDIRHMQTGYLAAARDAGDLSRGIERLLSDETLRVRPGAQARRIVETDYPLQLEVRRYAELYQDVRERLCRSANARRIDEVIQRADTRGGSIVKGDAI